MIRAPAKTSIPIIIEIIIGEMVDIIIAATVAGTCADIENTTTVAIIIAISVATTDEIVAINKYTLSLLGYIYNMDKQEFTKKLENVYPGLEIHVGYMFIGPEREEETLLVNNWEFGIRWSPGIDKLGRQEIEILLERCQERIFYFLAEKKNAPAEN